MTDRIEQFLKQKRLERAVAGPDLLQFKCACGQTIWALDRETAQDFRCAKCFGVPVEQTSVEAAKQAVDEKIAEERKTRR